MANVQKKNPEEKEGLHPRNKHRSRYDFSLLIKSCPELSKFVFTNIYNNETINFGDPIAVKFLNKALLNVYYGITNWDIPANYLCPPIPGRADYIHYISDLLAGSNSGTIPIGQSVSCLDVGTGANCIYPLIGNREYGWSFVGCDIDEKAILSAKNNATQNAISAIEIRKQNNPSSIFQGVMKPNEVFDVSICNPPFHRSLEEAMEGTTRKVRNLNSGKRTKPVLNFGGQHAELWCDGGELEFVSKMVKESAMFQSSFFWFTTLVSKSTNLPGIYFELKKVNAYEVKTIEMKQGNKISRIVAWTFLNDTMQKEWQKLRFNNQR